MKKIKLFAGIDVQIKRGCSYYVIDQDKRFVSNGWVKSNDISNFSDIFNELTNPNLDKIAIGIDAPRMPLKKLRNRYFNKKAGKWVVRDKQSIGRECEVLINSYRLANCQWTNIYEKSPEWMQLGFSIFESISDFPFVYEVFPTASYKMLENESLKYEVCLKNFKPGVKDMLDASVAAITVKAFIDGQGEEVGGEDGLGTIILPRKIKDF